MTHLAEILESILFVSANAIEIDFVAEKLNLTKQKILDCINNELKQKYNAESGVNILLFNDKVQFCTNPKYVKEVEAVLNPIKEKELTNAMLETLAIIAYKQPITRLEVEEIRGVDSTYSIQSLLKTNMIVPLGRKDTIGKPILFGTTDEFLKRFSLSSISDLPDYDGWISKLQSIGEDTSNVEIVDKPMFNNEIPDFLKDEDFVEIID